MTPEKLVEKSLELLQRILDVAKVVDVSVIRHRRDVYRDL